MLSPIAISDIIAAYEAASPRAVEVSEAPGDAVRGKGGRLHAPHDGFEYEGIAYRGGEFLPEDAPGCGTEIRVWASEAVARALAERVNGTFRAAQNGRGCAVWHGSRGQADAVAAAQHPSFVEMPLSEIEAAGLAHGKVYRRETLIDGKWRRVKVARVYREIVA